MRISTEGFEKRCSVPKLVKGRAGLWYIDIDCSQMVAKRLVKSPGILEFASRDDYK